MNTRNKNLKQLLDELRTPEHQLLSRAHVLQGHYLVQIEAALDRLGLTQKDLAEKVDVSAGHISRLFTSDKLTNFKMLARIEQALGIEFDRMSAISTAVAEKPVSIDLSAWNQAERRAFTYLENTQILSDIAIPDDSFFLAA